MKLAWDPKDKKRRKWMVKTRKKLNRRIKGKNYNLNVDKESFTMDEFDLFYLEEELHNADQDDYQTYMQEIKEADDTDPEEDEETGSKN